MMRKRMGRKWKAGFLKSANAPHRSGDQGRTGNKVNGNGAVRQNMPLNSILSRMAGTVLHERVVPKQYSHFQKRKGKRLISDEQIRQMRSEYKPHVVTLKMLSDKYGVSASYAASIVNGYTAADVI